MGRRVGVERIKSKKLELGGNIESTSQPALAEVEGLTWGPTGPGGPRSP